ncbi:MAG: hypothetical protein OXB88_01030 [Bacteriovoracales bacterium]|nr:hypothetical protein [Bacteriovoracales bacterium]
MEEKNRWHSLGIRPLDLSEAIAMSWIFKIISSILMLVILNLGEFFTFVHPLLKFHLPTHSLIIFIGCSTAFYPLKTILTVILWKWAVRVFGLLYMDDEEIEKHLNDILAHSLSSNVLLAVPFVGPIFQEILWPFYLFAGLKNTYRLGPFQAMSIFSLFFFFSLLLLLALFMATISILF